MRESPRGRILSLESLVAAVCVVVLLWAQAPRAFSGEAFYSLDGPLTVQPWRGELFGREGPPPAHNPTLHEEDFLYFPGLCHLVRTWHDTGSLALWNPHVYCGAPMAGNVQFPAFYPFHLLLPLFCPRSAPFDPADLAFGLSVTGLLRWGLAAWFAFLWLRRLGASRLGAAAGAAVLAFGPYLCSWIQFTPGQVVSLFPAVLFCAEGFLAAGSALSLLGLGAWLAASNLGGYPQTSVFLVAFLLLYLAVRARGAGRTLRSLWPALAAIALACAAAAVSWLPFLDTLGQSELQNLRKQEPLWPDIPVSSLVLFSAGAWACLCAAFVPALSRVRYLQGILIGAAFALGALAGGDAQLHLLLLPDASGNPARGGYGGPQNWIEVNQDALGTGVALLALAVVPLTRGDHRAKLGAGVLGAAILYGMRFPLLYQLGRTLLPLAAPTRISVLVPICSALVVALALTELPSVLEPFVQEILRSAFRKLLAALAVFIMALRYLGLAAFSVDKVGIVLAVVGACVVFMLQGRARRDRNPVLDGVVRTALLAALAVAGALWPAFRFHPTMPRADIYPVTPAVATLLAEQKNDPTLRVFAVDRGCFTPNSPEVFGVSQALGYDNFDPFNFIRLLDNLTVPPALPRIQWNTSRFALGRPLWRLLAARFVATDMGLRPEGWRVVHEGPGFRILEDPGALPRAFLSKGVYWIHDDPSRLERTPPREAVALSRKEAVSIQGPALTQGDAVIERLLPDEVLVKTNGDGNGFLVLLDEDLPGWRAWVDDRPATIENAFVCFRAVAVPAGEHRVLFRYLPDSFVLGLRVSIGALIALVVLAVLTAVWLRVSVRAGGRAPAALS